MLRPTQVNRVIYPWIRFKPILKKGLKRRLQLTWSKSCLIRLKDNLFRKLSRNLKWGFLKSLRVRKMKLFSKSLLYLNRIRLLQLLLLNQRHLPLSRFHLAVKTSLYRYQCCNRNLTQTVHNRWLFQCRQLQQLLPLPQLLQLVFKTSQFQFLLKIHKILLQRMSLQRSLLKIRSR